MPSYLSKYIGNYPAEYNRAVHGPYDPSRFYGPRDARLSEVKVNELVSWINRRNVHPVAVSQAISRGYYRILRRYADPKFSSPTIFFFQLITLTSLGFYFLNYPKNLRHHKQAKYHW